MVISMGISADHHETETSLLRKYGILFGRLALGLTLAFALAACPAEAKKRQHKRSHYAPPPAAMVVDAYSGKVLYADHADQPRFPASVTKVMTLYLLFDQVDKGRLSLDSRLKVSVHAASRPPSKLDLDPGGEISVRDAMYALVTKSANDVAAVIAENIAGSETAFARMMTQKARSIGMNDTTFKNASGLPDPGQTTTARDLVTLGRSIMQAYPEASKIFRTRYFEFGEARFKNHNSLLFTYPGMDGMKTGFTQASGFNLLASCHRNDKHLIAVVLGGSSSRERNARMRSLLDQSWSKAVALNELKQRGKDAPALVAGILSSDLMPERNPAFHSDAAEHLVAVAIDQAEGQHNGAKAEDAGGPPVALAAITPQDQAQDDDDEDAAEAEGVEQGDAAAETAANTEDAPKTGGANDGPSLGPYHIQVGSFLDAGSAKERLELVAAKTSGLMKGHGELTVSGEVKGKSYFRARFGQFSRKGASDACAKVEQLDIECMVVRAE